MFAASGALALSGCTSNVDTSEPTTQTTTATAQEEFVVEDVAEKTVTELPAGPLYWHVENFPALADADAAAGPLSLAADVEGKVWLFTLGPKGTPMHGGSMVTEIGPLVYVSAPEYLLAVSHGVAAPGAKSGVHTHPGTEAFLVLEGQLSQQTPHGVNAEDSRSTLRPPCSCGHAQPGQSNPWRWLSRASAAAVRTAPICCRPRCNDTMTALTPAASRSGPAAITPCSSNVASISRSGWRPVPNVSSG